MADTIFRLYKKWHSLIVILLLFIIFYSINMHRDILMKYVQPDLEISIPKGTSNRPVFSDDQEIKYILLWTNPKNTPFNYFGKGRSVFINKSCSFTNCYVTSDRNFLGDYTEFEVIAFNGPEINDLRYINDLPKRRFRHQKYVYANIESAAIYPVCSKIWNNYFNWTWTYKLNSNAVWGYFVIRDKKFNIVGPKSNMQWMNMAEMEPIDDKLKVLLSSKTRPVAWFVSNCNTLSLREDFVRQVEDHLRDYNLEVDIYGECGNLQCPKFISNRCFKMLEKKYFFYFAFENSLSDDYVTEKILNALLHNTVPIVFGGANYTRFIPKGAYLDARQLGPKKLAEKIFQILHSLHEYFDFFKWKRYYSYHFTDERPDSDVYCTFCKMINDRKLLRTETIYKDFSLWWTPEKYCRDSFNITRYY